MDKAIEHICQWLKDWSDKAGLKGFTVGVSGGVDSALTSALCCRTGLPTAVVSMPIHQQPAQLERAREHIAWLVERHPDLCSPSEVDLTSVFDSFKASMGAEQPNDLALANTRARLRMATLYAVAQTRKQLVAGTGNRVEDFGVGFFTKYGDGGVDISPIADLFKSDVYRMAKHLGIPQSILDAEPTDGLWEDGRTDADQIQASYDELEWAMQYHGNGADLTQKQRQLLLRYNELRRANLHKMEPIPVCKIPQELLRG